jgi:predicted nucleotidyltransferase
MDFATVDPASLAAVVEVVEQMCLVEGIDRSSLLLVGAESRNLLHAALGHTLALRRTSDLDIGIAVTDWVAHEALIAGLTATGSTGIRYLVAGIPVDVMPFGSVEAPQGTVTPPARGEGLDVFGFTQVFADATTVPFDGLTGLRIPTPAGYAALKMKAWVDRSARHEYRDAPDLATAMFWYQEAPDVRARLYGREEGVAILERYEFDQDAAAVALLGADVAQILGPVLAVRLHELWGTTRTDLLVLHMGQAMLPSQGDATTRARWVEALGAGLTARG